MQEALQQVRYATKQLESATAQLTAASSVNPPPAPEKVR